MIGHCDFCHQDFPLRNSHIVSRFLFQNLKGPKGHLIGINGLGPHGSARLQDGLKQHLFCHACEQFFSTQFERPYEQFWRKHGPLPNPWRGLEVCVVFDYAPFKLFHLLNLYRAGVSTLASYQHVKLGPHLDSLRDMLRNKDPGSAEEYQVAGSAMLESAGRLARLVTVPQKRRYEMMVAWETCYSGVSWMVAVSGSFPSSTKAAALQEDGSMHFMALPLLNYAVIHKASEMLNRRWR
jgi:hypothetical protein